MTYLKLPFAISSVVAVVGGLQREAKEPLHQIVVIAYANVTPLAGKKSHLHLLGSSHFSTVSFVVSVVDEAHKVTL